MDETDVVVVGAGLAGLQCARTLRDHGLQAVVLEDGRRARRPGAHGRRRRLPLRPGLPAPQPRLSRRPRHVDVAALDMRYFGRGVVVAGSSGLRVVADPGPAPTLLAATLRSGYVRPTELARLAPGSAPALGRCTGSSAGPTRRGRVAGPAGVTGRLRHEILEPFLTGSWPTTTGSTSATFVRLLLRSFVRATPGVPALGMQALPDQLAPRLSTSGSTPGSSGSGPGRARSATDAGTRVAPRGRGRHRPGSAAATPDAAKATPAEGPADLVVRRRHLPRPRPTFLRVDGAARAGPVVNTAVMTAVAPTTPRRAGTWCRRRPCCPATAPSRRPPTPGRAVRRSGRAGGSWWCATT